MNNFFDLIIELCYSIAILHTRETPKLYERIPTSLRGGIGVYYNNPIKIAAKISANSKNILQHKSICSKSIK